MHSRFHVILLDFVVANVDRSGVFGVIRLGDDMLSCLVVGVEVVDRLGIAKEFEYFSDIFACLIGDVFTRCRGFNYKFFSVGAPVEERAV